MGAKLWDELPENLVLEDSIVRFRTEIKRLNKCPYRYVRNMIVLHLCDTLLVCCKLKKKKNLPNLFIYPESNIRASQFSLFVQLDELHLNGWIFKID